MKNLLRNMLDALSSGRVIFLFLLLLIIVFIDHFLLQPIFSELDVLEHFLFGFIISEAVSRVETSTDMLKRLTKRISKENPLQFNLFIRLLGFLIIGGLFWESLEFFLFPSFGVPCNPFFGFPITLHNIDGTIDVTVGILGCALAWCTAKGTSAGFSNAS